MKYSERDELVASLRELADFVEKKGIALPKPVVWASVSVYEYDDDWQIDDEKTKVKMAKIAKALSPCDKDYRNETFVLKRKFGDIELDVTTRRSTICRKVVVGKKMETKYERVEVGTEEVDVVEWVCDDALLKA